MTIRAISDPVVARGPEAGVGLRIRTRGLDQRLPAVSIVSGAEPEHTLAPGDFLLGRAHGRKHDVIRWGQRLRLAPGDRHYADYTHAALVTSRDGDLIEAVGEGVRASALVSYVVGREAYQVVRIHASDEDRRQVVDFAKQALDARAPYGLLTTVSITLWAFTGARLTFFMDGSHTCSGLVAAALERTSASFGMNAARVMPAQLAAFFGAPPTPLPPAAPRRSAG